MTTTKAKRGKPTGETSPMIVTARYLMGLVLDPSIPVADVIELLGGELTPDQIRAMRAGKARITGDSEIGFQYETREGE